MCIPEYPGGGTQYKNLKSMNVTQNYISQVFFSGILCYWVKLWNDFFGFA